MKYRFSILLLVSAAVLVVVDEADASLIVGTELATNRNSASDGATGVFFTNYVGMPAYGTVGSAAIRYQGSSFTFQVLQLRPTGTADQYDILYNSGTITPSGTSGTTSILDFPNGATAVLPGDIFAHYGRGIPYTDSPGDIIVQGGDGGANAVPIFYSTSASAILVGNTINISTSSGDTGIPIRTDLVRDYAFAVVLIPEPTTGVALLAMGVGLLLRRPRRKAASS